MEIKEKHPEIKKIRNEVLRGLRASPKTLPSKYFYDDRGSKLFEQISELNEYYPTRTEISIMEENINEIVQYIGEGVSLIEFGSGSSYKTRLLLDHLENIKSYVPVDISEDFLKKSAEKLHMEYSGLSIFPVATDYTEPFRLPDDVIKGRKIIYFPGSTIGNFSREKAREFLKSTAELCDENGALLIGVDLKKDRQLLENAYNDNQGITAEFNRNILFHLNNLLDANFDTGKFEHRAVYNENPGRIEMYLIAIEHLNVSIGGEIIEFEKGEWMMTEISCKYTIDEFRSLASGIFSVEKTWTDHQKWFSVQYLTSEF